MGSERQVVLVPTRSQVRQELEPASFTASDKETASDGSTIPQGCTDFPLLKRMQGCLESRLLSASAAWSFDSRTGTTPPVAVASRSHGGESSLKRSLTERLRKSRAISASQLSDKRFPQRFRISLRASVNRSKGFCEIVFTPGRRNVSPGGANHMIVSVGNGKVTNFQRKIRKSVQFCVAALGG